MGKPAKKSEPKPDDVVIHDVEQRTDDWLRLRLGMPTASRFATIMASGKDGDDSVSRAKLLHVLAGEILTGEVADTFRNEAMDRGTAWEAEAREYYERKNLIDVNQVGFVTRTIHHPLGTTLTIGASPDAMVGTNRILEIKTMRPDLLIALAKRGPSGFPPRHRAQCQGGMWVTGVNVCDAMFYSRGMPVAPTFQIERDEIYIRQIQDAVEVFAYELKRLVEDVRNMGKR